MFNYVQPVKAVENYMWSAQWLNHVDYYESPINLSTTTIVSDANGHCTNTIELVVSVGQYLYDAYVNRDYVYFMAAVYVKASADPGYQPQYATDVTIKLTKSGTDQEHTCTAMKVDHSPPGGHSQGEGGLVQTQVLSSSLEDRLEYA
jgi:hypothetical protein